MAIIKYTKESNTATDAYLNIFPDQFLTKKELNGLQDSEVQWNFQKYLIGTNGQLEKVLSPQVSPTDSSIVDWITK